MKIGLLTISQAYNYGALLQTYATCSILKKLGHEVVLIESKLEDSTKLSFRSVLGRLAFYSFPYFRLPRIYPAKYDASISIYIVGSDQVWNPYITKGKYKKFFLDFLPDHVPCFSYSSSFGFRTWNYPELTNEVATLLSRFKAIAVRESSGIDICKENFNVKANLVLDPTLLISDYSELTGRKVSNKTLFTYFKLNQSTDWSSLINVLSQRLNASFSDVRYSEFKLFNRQVSVEGWIRTIASSKFLVTDSYHGMIFAILNKTNFIILPSSSLEIMERAFSLLELLDLNERFFHTIDDAINSDIILKDIDYDLVHAKLEKARIHSIDYLVNSLKLCLDDLKC